MSRLFTASLFLLFKAREIKQVKKKEERKGKRTRSTRGALVSRFLAILFAPSAMEEKDQKIDDCVSSL